MTDSAIRTILVVFVMLVFTSACSSTSFTTIDPTHESINQYIKSGDEVKVMTKDRRALEFEVTEINSQSIKGNDKQVLFSEIDTIEKKQEDKSSFYYILKGLEAASSLPF